MNYSLKMVWLRMQSVMEGVRRGSLRSERRLLQWSRPGMVGTLGREL